MSLADTLKDRLTARRAHLQQELEVTLPAVTELESRIEGARETITRLERRRDVLAAWGDKRVEVPNQPGRLPELGSYMFELEPLRSVKTGKQLAAEVQDDIDQHTKTIRDSERAIQRLLEGRG